MRAYIVFRVDTYHVSLRLADEEQDGQCLVAPETPGLLVSKVTIFLQSKLSAIYGTASRPIIHKDSTSSTFCLDIS